MYSRTLEAHLQALTTRVLSFGTCSAGYVALRRRAETWGKLPTATTATEENRGPNDPIDRRILCSDSKAQDKRDFHTCVGSFILYSALLYYTILYYTLLYYTILYYTILCYTILYYTILYYTILYYTILYYMFMSLGSQTLDPWSLRAF